MTLNLWYFKPLESRQNIYFRYRISQKDKAFIGMRPHSDLR